MVKEQKYSIVKKNLWFSCDPYVEQLLNHSRLTRLLLTTDLKLKKSENITHE